MRRWCPPVYDFSLIPGVITHAGYQSRARNRICRGLGMKTEAAIRIAPLFLQLLTQVFSLLPYWVPWFSCLGLFLALTFFHTTIILRVKRTNAWFAFVFASGLSPQRFRVAK